MGRWGSVGRSPLGGLNFSESRQTGKKKRVGKKAKVRPSYLIFLLENPAVTGARQIWRSLHKEKCCTAIDLADLRTELRVPADLLPNSRLSSLVNIPNWPPLVSFQTAFFLRKRAREGPPPPSLLPGSTWCPLASSKVEEGISPPPLPPPTHPSFSTGGHTG